MAAPLRSKPPIGLTANINHRGYSNVKGGHYYTTMFSAKALSSLAARSTLRRVAPQQAKNGARRWAGDMPVVPQSSKARLWEGHPTKPEGWETTIYFYYSLSAVMIFCIINFSPDTSIEAWAQQEAKARLALKAKGFTDFEFGKHYQDEAMDDESGNWDKFTEKAIRMGDDLDLEFDDDDDDDDDDEDEDDDDDDDDDDDE